MTTIINPAIILNDEIRAYLQTKETQQGFNDGVTFNQDKDNRELVNTTQDFMKTYGNSISITLTAGKQALDMLGANANSVERQKTAKDTLDKLALCTRQFLIAQ